VSMSTAANFANALWIVLMLPSCVILGLELGNAAFETLIGADISMRSKSWDLCHLSGAQ
jgi:S-formylglutathione hydrolase FrmB